MTNPQPYPRNITRALLALVDVSSRGMPDGLTIFAATEPDWQEFVALPILPHRSGDWLPGIGDESMLSSALFVTGGRHAFATIFSRS